MTLVVCGLPFEHALSEALGERPELGAERALVLRGA